MASKKKGSSKRVSKSEEKEPEERPPATLPSLTLREQEELKDVMLKMALELERSKRFEEIIDHTKLKKGLANLEFKKQEKKLQVWNRKFDKKLRKYGFTIDDVDVDAETGKVKLSTAHIAARDMANARAKEKAKIREEILAEIEAEKEQ